MSTPKPSLLYVNTHSPADKEFGGVVRSASLLLEELSKNFKTTYLSAYLKEPIKPDANYRYVGSKTRFLQRHGFAFALIFKVFREVRQNDIIYVNGVFTFPVTLAYIFSFFLRKKKVIATIRGGAEPWRVSAKSRFVKLSYFWLLRNLRIVRLIHCTSIEEKRNVEDLLNSPCFVLPNPIESTTLDRNSISLHKLKTAKRKLLFVSRFSPEKGLDVLDQAIRLLPENELSRFELDLVGPGGKKFCDENAINFICSHTFLDGLFGSELIAKYASSDGFILPSRSENFGNVVAEALSYGCYVITTTGTPWGRYSGKFSGSVVPCDPKAIADAISIWLSCGVEELENCFVQNMDFVNDEFGSGSIGRVLAEEFSKL